MKYKITAISAHVSPQEFFAETKEEVQEIRRELRDLQYRVEVEEMTMQLTQSDKLDILSFIGNHPDNEEPLAQEGPRFPYSAIRDRIKDYAPPVPRSYARDDEQAEDEEDDEEDTDEQLLEETLRGFARSKQGREVSPWILPSSRSRREVFDTLATMGCTMEG